MEDNKDEAKGSVQPNLANESKNVGAYSNLVRGLTSEELSQSGTQKLILHDLENTQSKVNELEPKSNESDNMLTHLFCIDLATFKKLPNLSNQGCGLFLHR